ncbi:MAG: MarR family transcriptional regulator [Thermogemmatispora sp.]|uniref:MarR family winged helix-turn-helix transcriptional regulator n=1 Tax=Thermogemmatispora sp. TaxID=1968838 RepID=UPI00260DD72B|nr:MarR family transcriptional regulator [Thermogemmatispora sp.]MBX5457396.1 MarR family transcriptional regulator [Thermogemmatispora sp.]
MLCERSTVTRLVDYLESEGLLARSPDPTDRRSQRVTLTAAGVARRREAQATIEQAIRRRFSVLNREEERQLIAMLKRLRNVVSAEIEASLRESDNS